LNISAPTENHIDALELADGTVRSRPEPRCDHGRTEQTLKQRSAEQFLGHVSRRLADIRPVNVKDAAHVTLQVLNPRLDPQQVEKVRQALPENIRALWPTGTEGRRFEPAA